MNGMSPATDPDDVLNSSTSLFNILTHGSHILFAPSSLIPAVAHAPPCPLPGSNMAALCPDKSDKHPSSLDRSIEHSSLQYGPLLNADLRYTSYSGFKRELN